MNPAQKDIEPQRPLRILHLVSSERWTGVAEPVVSLARHQENLGHDVWLACMPGQSFELNARMAGLRIMRGITLNRRGILAHIKDYYALRQFITMRSIDILHSHLINDHWLAALSRRGLPQAPALVRTFHRYQVPRRDRLHSWLFCRQTDTTITTSDDLRRRISQVLPFHNGSLAVVLGGVNTDKFHPENDGEKIRRELDIPPTAPTAGLVARMSKNRGHLWLMDCLPQVYNRLPQARCMIAGRGQLKYTLRGRANSPEHNGRTIMAGYRTQDLPDVYAAFNVGLFLGQTSEGSCRSALEVMASGLPLIGINRGAVPHYIEHGRTGLLVEPDDRPALTKALIEMLSDPDKTRAMGTAARRAVEENFNENRRAENILEQYHSALRNKAHEKN